MTEGLRLDIEDSQRIDELNTLLKGEQENKQENLSSFFKLTILKKKRRQPTIFGHIVLSSSLILMVVIAFFTMYAVSGIWERNWLEQLPSSSRKLDEQTYNLGKSSPEKDRLIAQLKEIESRSKRHKIIMSFFYKQYYISLSMMGVAASIGSLCLIFISKHGWKDINNAILNIFFVSAGVVVFFGNITVIFQQEENLKASQDIYLGYIDLRQEMLSYWATLRNNKAEKLETYKYIHYIDNQLKKLNQVRIGFDPSRISNFSKQLEEISKPETVTPQQAENSTS